MKRFKPIHKIYGGLRIIQICRDWPRWFHEYFTGLNDGSSDRYRMRCGIELYVRHNRSDFHMIDEIWAYRKYDYFGYRVSPGDIVVDIGANIGTFSLYAAKVCGAARVISFEPFLDNFRLLTKNVEQNQLPSVACVNEAVAGSRGSRTLRLSSMDAGSHSLVTSPSGRTVEVNCCTLDDVFTRFSLPRIDYLKVDCEGAEYEILESATCRLQQIGRISMETHTTSTRRAEDLAMLLRRHGFAVKLWAPERLYATRLP
jgi:FkbM family methyltransferase